MDLALAIPAYDALGKLLKAADECRALFDAAGMEYPEPLRRMVGEYDPITRTTLAAQTGEGLVTAQGQRPLGAGSGWIDIPQTAAITQTAIRGVLRAAARPISTNQIISELRARGFQINEGSVLNVGPRFEMNRIIVRSKDGWRLVDMAKNPILKDGRVWGTPDMFTKQELAARRRETILTILESEFDGLANVEITRRLEANKDLRTPLSRELVKADMEELRRLEKVRRLDNYRWVLIGIPEPENLFTRKESA